MIPKKPHQKFMVGLGFILCAISVFGLFFYSLVSAKENTLKSGTNEEVYEVSGPVTIEVILQRHYLDGEISEEVINEEILSMEDFWANYKEWKLVAQDDGKMIFKQKVDDISPLLKANGYFGLSDDGTLTIYKGKPSPDNAIQSFFQIDVGKLESRQHEELKNGIPIRTKDQYKQVIEGFKIYSLN